MPLESFAALFHGRGDVWGSVEGKNNKEPITEEHYRLHLEGKRSLGIYPLLDDGTCHFWAVDIDDKSFEKARAIRDAMYEFGLPMYIAESKSKGYHVYGFCSEGVPAADVRMLLFLVLEKLGVQAEIFPKQDRLDEVIKYGNYINLPCFGDTRLFQTGDHKPLVTEEAIKRIIPAAATAIQQAKNSFPPPVVMIPQKVIPTKGHKKLSHPPCIEAILKGVNQGCRDEAAFALARHYLDGLYLPEEVLSLLLQWDTRNKPPIGDTRVIQTKVQSAQKGYAFGCSSIKSDDLLSGFCPGESKCTWLQEAIKEKKKKGLLAEKSFYETADFLYEEITDTTPRFKQKNPRFLRFNRKTGEISEVTQIEDEGITIVPAFGEEVVLGAVLFPTGIEPYGSIDQLHKEICEHITRYVDILSLDLEQCAWYVIMTWCPLDQLFTTPYLRFKGDTGCLTGDTRIAMGNGDLVPLGSLNETRTLRMIGQKGALTANFSHRFEYPNMPVIEIMIESGKRLVATAGHELLKYVPRSSIDEASGRWTSISSLKVGDRVRVATKLPGERVRSQVELAALIGYGLGDSHIRKNRPNVVFYISDLEKELMPILGALMTSQGIKYATYTRSPEKGRTVSIHFLDASGKSIEALLCLRNKAVPEIIMTGSDETVAVFLSWFFTAEGCVYQKGRGKSGIVLTQRNPQILRDCQLLLLRFAIHSRIVGKDLYIRRADAILKFAEHIGFQSLRKKDKLVGLVKYASTRASCARLRQPWEKIVSIKEAGSAQVYDLRVPFEERYVANGILVHNCGKSRCLDTIGRLCYKPLVVSGAITPAPIYRIISKYNGTIILDEADFSADNDEKSEVMKVLNSGFEIGRPILRCVKDDPSNFDCMDSFGPKVMATRFEFPDMALEGRCLTIKTEETDRDDIPPILGKRFRLAQQQIRKKLLAFRLANFSNTTEDIEVEDMQLGSIEPRLKQTGTPMAIALRGNPEALDKFKTWLKARNQELISERTDSAAGRIVLAVLRAAQVMGKEYVTPEAVQKIAAEEFKFDLTPQKVGRVLKSLNIARKKYRLGGVLARYIIWEDKLMKKLARRYTTDMSDYGELFELKESNGESH